jgi:hypothetical protein
LEDLTARSLTPTFEVMANKSLREYSAPTPDNIRTGPTVAVGNAAFELKPALINMVQDSQFCGKAHEDANKLLQHFLETRIVPVRCYGQTTKLFYCSPNYCTGKKHEGSLLETVTISSLLKNSRIAQARKFAKLKYYTWYYTCQG